MGVRTTKVRHRATLGQGQSRLLGASENNPHTPDFLNRLSGCQPANLPIQRPSVQTVTAGQANLHELMVLESAFDLDNDAFRNPCHPHSYCRGTMMREAAQIASLFGSKGHGLP